MLFHRRAALAALCCLSLASPAFAHGYQVGDLEIGHPWTRATPPSARVAGGFLKITNRGAAPDRLVSASFEGSSTVEIHEMAHANGVMTMRELPKGLEIKPGETVELKPGGFHLMFMGLKAQLAEKQRLKGVLTFEKAGRVEVEYVVESMGARGGDAHGNHGGGHGGGHHGNHGAKTQ